MQLEFIKIEEANDIINQLIEHHPHSIFLTDNELKIKYFNKAFQNLIKRDKRDILDHEFCDIMGCSQREQMGEKSTKYCINCQLKDLLSGANMSELVLIREFVINNKVVTKHLHIDAHRVIMDGQKYRLVVIDDRTQKHK